MENTIPYCGDLHIDATTKQLILNLLGSIRSVVPVASPPGPGSPEHDPDVRSQDSIRNILVLARQHSEELDGLFNPDELLRYSRYISDYQDLVVQLECILEEVKSCRDSAWNFASKMSELVEGHIRMTSPPHDHHENYELREIIPMSQDEVKLKVV